MSIVMRHLLPAAHGWSLASANRTTLDGIMCSSIGGLDYFLRRLPSVVLSYPRIFPPPPFRLEREPVDTLHLQDKIDLTARWKTLRDSGLRECI